MIVAKKPPATVEVTPLRTEIVPVAWFAICTPKIASTPSSTPWPTSSLAPPGGVSSACWKISLTAPSKLSVRPLSTWAVPSSMAVWAS